MTSSSTSCLPTSVTKDTSSNHVASQKPVEISDVAYQPQHSPTSEIAPSFPSQSGNGDIDSQINYYQRELEKIMENQQQQQQHDVLANGQHKLSSMGYDEDLIDGPEKSKSSWIPVLLVVLVVLLISAIVFTYFLLESERELPVFKALRKLPRVQSIKQHYYAPLREYVVRRVSRLFKRSVTERTNAEL